VQSRPESAAIHTGWFRSECFEEELAGSIEVMNRWPADVIVGIGARAIARLIHRSSISSLTIGTSVACHRQPGRKGTFRSFVPFAPI
jgi:hypothetical protein